MQEPVTRNELSRDKNRWKPERLYELNNQRICGNIRKSVQEAHNQGRPVDEDLAQVSFANERGKFVPQGFQRGRFKALVKAVGDKVVAHHGVSTTALVVATVIVWVLFLLETVIGAIQVFFSDVSTIVLFPVVLVAIGGLLTGLGIAGWVIRALDDDLRATYSAEIAAELTAPPDETNRRSLKIKLAAGVFIMLLATWYRAYLSDDDETLLVVVITLGLALAIAAAVALQRALKVRRRRADDANFKGQSQIAGEACLGEFERAVEFKWPPDSCYESEFFEQAHRLGEATPEGIFRGNELSTVKPAAEDQPGPNDVCTANNTKPYSLVSIATQTNGPLPKPTQSPTAVHAAPQN